MKANFMFLDDMVQEKQMCIKYNYKYENYRKSIWKSICVMMPYDLRIWAGFKHRGNCKANKISSTTVAAMNQLKISCSVEIYGIRQFLTY